MNTRALGLVAPDRRPLIAHVVFRFDVGGLENGVVNLVNQLPVATYRHAIVSLTEITDYRAQIVRDDVRFFALNKKPGHGFWLYPKLVQLFRRLAPDIVHTRNLAALEATVPAWFAGVPLRVHGEHGRDVGDFDGSNRMYQRIRRVYRPFVSHYVALSQDLERYLTEKIGVDSRRITRICNGVDTSRFAPTGRSASIAGNPFTDPDLWLVGTVGRMQVVKDQVTLARAFVRAVQSDMSAHRMRLVMVGDGPLHADVERVLNAAGLRELAWLPGERRDIPDILRSLDCFVLPSLAEGISNAILEAMATGLPVVATRVGGNSELIDDGLTGRLIPAADVNAMAGAILAYFKDADTAGRCGLAARQAAMERFSIDRMVHDYALFYNSVLSRHRVLPARAGASG